MRNCSRVRGRFRTGQSMCCDRTFFSSPVVCTLRSERACIYIPPQQRVPLLSLPLVAQCWCRIDVISHVLGCFFFVFFFPVFYCYFQVWFQLWYFVFTWSSIWDCISNFTLKAWKISGLMQKECKGCFIVSSLWIIFPTTVFSSFHLSAGLPWFCNQFQWRQPRMCR